MSNQNPPSDISSRRADWLAVLFVLIFPTIGTIGYFVLLDGLPPTIQKAATDERAFATPSLRPSPFRTLVWQ